ncbi:hypothetical protein MKX01_022372 [Papaver californicum]|nr:hypothetical protein MKX01_022372 [Papaver californicum]
MMIRNFQTKKHAFVQIGDFQKNLIRSYARQYRVLSRLRKHDLISQEPYSPRIRAIIFSCDHDMCVPFTGSEAWTRSLGYKIVDEWRPWFFNGEVAGYVSISFCSSISYYLGVRIHLLSTKVLLEV